MGGLQKLKKAELITLLEGIDATQFDLFKQELGLPYNTDEEWIDYIKRLQTLNAERLKDLTEAVELLKLTNDKHKDYMNNTHR